MHSEAISGSKSGLLASQDIRCAFGVAATPVVIITVTNVYLVLTMSQPGFQALLPLHPTRVARGRCRGCPYYPTTVRLHGGQICTAGTDCPADSSSRRCSDVETRACCGVGTACALKMSVIVKRQLWKKKDTCHHHPPRLHPRSSPSRAPADSTNMLRVWFLFLHNIRRRRRYWAKYIVLIIHISGNSIVATCHLLRLEGNIVNIVLQRH